MADTQNIEIQPSVPITTVDELIKIKNIDMSVNADMSQKLQQIKADFDRDIAELERTLEKTWDDLDTGNYEEIKDCINDVKDYGDNCIDVMNDIESAKVSGLYDDNEVIDDDTRQLMDDAYDEAEEGFNNANKFQKGLFTALSDKFYTAKLNHQTKKALEKVEATMETPDKKSLVKSFARPLVALNISLAAGQILPAAAAIMAAPPVVLGFTSAAATFVAIQSTVIFVNKVVDYAKTDYTGISFYDKASQCKKLQEKMDNLSEKYASGNAITKPLYKAQFKAISTVLGKYLNKAEVLREKAIKSGEKTYSQLVEINNKRNNRGMEENEQLTEVMTQMRESIDALYNCKEAIQKNWRDNKHADINVAAANYPGASKDVVDSNIVNESPAEEENEENLIEEDEELDEPSID
jgi:hypothetical protein